MPHMIAGVTAPPRWQWSSASGILRESGRGMSRRIADGQPASNGPRPRQTVRRCAAGRPRSRSRYSPAGSVPRRSPQVTSVDAGQRPRARRRSGDDPSSGRWTRSRALTSATDVRPGARPEDRSAAIGRADVVAAGAADTPAASRTIGRRSRSVDVPAYRRTRVAASSNGSRRRSTPGRSSTCQLSDAAPRRPPRPRDRVHAGCPRAVGRPRTGPASGHVAAGRGIDPLGVVAERVRRQPASAADVTTGARRERTPSPVARGRYVGAIEDRRRGPCRSSVEPGRRPRRAAGRRPP